MIKIKPETGVPILDPRKASSGRKPRSPENQALVDTFAAMKPGQSFFVAGAVRKEVEFLRQLFGSAGLALQMREVEDDLEHRKAGVRVWRLHSACDMVPDCAYEPDLDRDTLEDDEL